MTHKEVLIFNFLEGLFILKRCFVQNVLYEKSVTTYLHKYPVYYTFIGVYIQWREKVFALFLILYFFACLSDLNVSDCQTNP